MNPAWASGWDAVTGSPVFGVTLTLGAYLLARKTWERAGRHPTLLPVLLAIVLVGGVLALPRVTYTDYLSGAALITFLLGPATVALAIPLHREIDLVKQAVAPILLGLVAGTTATITVAYLFTTGAGGSEQIALSMAPKSATVPVSIALSDKNGGIASLTAVLTIVAGILGAVIGPKVLTLLRIRDKRVRGFAIGVASHGIGTARMLQESRTEGAFSALAMALSALATAVALPILLAVMQ